MTGNGVLTFEVCLRIICTSTDIDMDTYNTNQLPSFRT